MFKVEDIKAGYLLVVRKGVDDPFNMTVVPGTGGCLGCCCPRAEWFPLERFDEELFYAGYDVVEIYSETCNMKLLDNSTASRELLWVRPVVRMTHKEIEEALGYPFEYVSDLEEEELKE